MSLRVRTPLGALAQDVWSYAVNLCRLPDVDGNASDCVPATVAAAAAAAVAF